MAIMQGDLAEYPVPDLLQFLQGTRKHGQLLLEPPSRSRTAGLFFDEGELVHACCPPTSGVRAVYEVLPWHEGRFAFVKDVEPEQRTIREDLQSVLLEGLRQLDELRRARTLLPPPDTVLHLERELQVHDDVRLTRGEWQVLALVNGRRTLADVVELSGRPAVEGSRIVSELLAARLVVTTADDLYLEAVVAARVSAASAPAQRTAPPTMLANLILKQVDGRRTLRGIRDALGCGTADLVEELRLLVRTGWVTVAAGHDEYRRFIET